MTRFLKPKLRAFLRDEQGSAHTIEFVLWVPLFIVLIIATIELGAMNMRHTQLERSMDYTVRDIRLGTGEGLTHDQIKDSICEGAPLLADCGSTLRLEMIPLDLRNWSDPTSGVDCVDTSDEVNPVRRFENGADNQLMYLRACYMYRPIAPMGVLAGSLYTDDQGYTRIVSFSAFVQEPSL